MNGSADAHFLKIAITLPSFFSGEAEVIAGLLDNGSDFVHLRKPDSTLPELRRLIEDIPVRLYPRIRLHDHHALAVEYGLGGVHLNGRNPLPPKGCRSVSRSCHSIAELSAPVPPGYELTYQTLSPIYDSISKPGYRSRFDLSDLTDRLLGLRVVALGGVTPANFPELEQAGFIGAAMLGSVWQNTASL